MKSTLRKQLLSRRLYLPTVYTYTASHSICKSLLELSFIDKIGSIALYHPIQNEVDVLDLEVVWRKAGVRVFLPVKAGFAEWDEDSQIELGLGNTKVPKDSVLGVPDIVITPLLGFDRKGYRIGYGGGFYDKIFAKYPNIIKVGVAFSFQEEVIIPREQHDIKLDYIITERELIKGNG